MAERQFSLYWWFKKIQKHIPLVFMETRSLIQDRSLMLAKPGLIPKASSIAMMLRFHDAEHEKHLMSQVELQSLNWV